MITCINLLIKQLFSSFFITTTITVTQQGGQRDQHYNGIMTDDKTVSKTPLLTSQKKLSNCFLLCHHFTAPVQPHLFQTKVTTEF